MAEGGLAYLMASGRHGTLYCGVTSDLLLRVSQHRDGVFAGFAAWYEVKRLVWHEHFFDIRDAISREKQIKNWRREWKCNLIEVDNQFWDDLAVGMGFPPLP
jgi:putative endonuclease